MSAPVVQQISVNGNCLNPISIGDLLVRRILYHLSSEMVTNSHLFQRRLLAVSLTMPQPLKKQILLERLSWNSCAAILLRKLFLSRTLSIPALAVSVQVERREEAYFGFKANRFACLQKKN